MNCLFISCHAALEYYMCQIFRDIDVNIPLYWMDINLDNPVRPQIPGYRDNREGRHFTTQRHPKKAWEKKDLEDIDFIYIMNFSDIDEWIDYYGQFGIPIVVHMFGQYTTELIKRIASLCNLYPHVNIVCYSRKEESLYKKMGIKNVQYIPFGLDSAEFDGWTGEDKVVLSVCNNVGKRGKKTECICGSPQRNYWEMYQKIIKGFHHVLVGKNTQIEGGKGLVSYEKLKRLYRSSRVFFSLGTVPAPYVLTQMESMMTGCPTVVFDNECGISGEELGGRCNLLSNDVSEIRYYIHRLLKDESFASSQSEKIRGKAVEAFSLNKIELLWKEVLSEIVK